MVTTLWAIFKTLVEISILWALYYQMLIFFEGTRAFQVLKGITYLIGLFLVSYLFHFETLIWLLTKLFGLWVIVLIILFQQELRQGLARLGQQHLFLIGLEGKELTAVIEELSTAVFKLSKGSVGCLIAIQRQNNLNTYIESGVPVDGKISAELLQTIFMPESPLHDGGVIIQGSRVAAASCLFPLTENPSYRKIIGTRHRAALGLTEQTDCVVLMVSEETSEISVAMDGRFIPVVNKERLQAILEDSMVSNNKKKVKNAKMVRA
jgi:diadenylate cyclase